MINMLKLRSFRLTSAHLLKMESKFCEFQNLNHLQLWECDMLEELSDLHQIGSLKQLDVKGCSKLKRFPKEFGEKEAFSLLEIFSLVELNELDELPTLEEGALLSLKIFTMVKCTRLKVLPRSYLNLQKLQNLGVNGCSMELENLKKIKRINTKVEVITMSINIT